MIDHTPDQLPAFDYLIDSPSLADENGLTTAIIISLFTDRLANADDLLPGDEDDRRGWWADAFSEEQLDLIGSRLWLLSREKETQDVVNRANDYAEESLQWLIDDGVVNRIEVKAGWLDKTSLTVSDVKTQNSISGLLALAVVVERNTEAPLKFQFNNFWTAI